MRDAAAMRQAALSGFRSWVSDNTAAGLRYLASTLFSFRLSGRGFLQLRKEQAGDKLRRRRANPALFMPAISADNHHSVVNPHETMQRLFTFALEYHFPIVTLPSAGHF